MMGSLCVLHIEYLQILTKFQMHNEQLYFACFATLIYSLRLRFPILVIKYALKVDNRVGATELIIKRKPKVVE